MGDRTLCSLKIRGILHTPADVDRLRAALQQADCNKDHAFLKGKDLAAGVLDLDPFDFEEVNYGDMSDDLFETLRALGLDYIWYWGAGSEYGPGVLVETWSPPFRSSESTVEGDLFLLLSDLNKPERIAQLQAFEAQWETVNRAPLVYVPSAHALLAHFADNPEALAAWNAHRDVWSDEEQPA